MRVGMPAGPRRLARSMLMWRMVVTPDTPAAIDFLRAFEPEGPWLLTAIRPDRKAISTRTFQPGDAELGEWLAEHNGTRNIYFSVNRPMRFLTKKADRGDRVGAERHAPLLRSVAIDRVEGFAPLRADANAEARQVDVAYIIALRLELERSYRLVCKRFSHCHRLSMAI